ncbi:MAG: adenylate/guanylate cyclase domain-containing protein [Candidatus Binatia bacterium]|nr:adenylate/guanylate cyclase domain-containing protein [Candidatus Binatia bacterium]
MQLRDGTFGQKALFALLVGIYAVGVALAVADKFERVGAPTPGWRMDGATVSPTTPEASGAGLRGGGRLVAINGASAARINEPGVVREMLGETNTLDFVRPGGAPAAVTISVDRWSWRGVAFTEGGTDLIALLFMVLGLTTFALRPYEPESWALLVVSSVAGGLLTTQLIPGLEDDALQYLYAATVLGIADAAPIHVALAFPVVHSILRERVAVLWGLYGFATAKVVFGWAAWFAQDPELMGLSSGLGTFLFLGATGFWIVRSAALALKGDAAVAQRARICLLGAFSGLAPVGLFGLGRDVFDGATFDSRYAYWALGFLLVALSRITLRHEIMNARTAVQQAVLYTFAVVALTTVGVVLMAGNPLLVVGLMFPVLYFWPRFDAYLRARLYPKRARFPEIIREIGGEIEGSTTIEEVLDILAQAPKRLCDAEGGVVMIFPGAPLAPAGVLRTNGVAVSADMASFEHEPLIELLKATRREVARDRIAVEPQYASLQGECHAGFDLLGVDVLLPIYHHQRVIGALGPGPRVRGDVYEAPEIDALFSVTQQASQAMLRVQATEMLHAREMEFADLKRFFPPQIIDQVMARGGAAELRSQRKIVTVFFADLRGFTSFSDRVEPEEVMATLSQFHEAMGRRIAEFAGTVERFTGDGIMVFFNDPVDQPDHAQRAVSMALGIEEDVGRLREEWTRKGYEIDVGMGIHTGYATCGFIGYEGRRDYGVIGNVTNLAARLSDAAGPGEILITAGVRNELSGGHGLEPAGELSLKGFHQSQLAFRLLPGDPAVTRS